MRAWIGPIAVVLATFAGTALAGCSSSGGKAPAADAGEDGGVAGASAIIGPAGGNVFTVDGTGVRIPPGALAAGGSSLITIEPWAGAPSPPSATVVGTPYVFGPEQIGFEAEVTLVVSFDPARLPAGATPADVVIYTAPVATQTFSALATSVVDGSQVSAPTRHFCIVVAAVPAGFGADGGVLDAAILDGGALDGTSSDGAVSDVTGTTDGGGDATVDAAGDAATYDSAADAAATDGSAADAAATDDSAVDAAAGIDGGTDADDAADDAPTSD